MIFDFCDADNSRSVNAEEFAVCINEMMGDEGEADVPADEMDDGEADEEADEEDAPAEGGDDELAAFN